MNLLDLNSFLSDPSATPRRDPVRLGPAARFGLLQMVRHPLVLLAMVTTQLVCAGAAVAAFQRWVGPLLLGRPEPSLLVWAGLFASHPEPMLRVGLAAALVTLSYLALGTAWTALTVALLDGRSARRALSLRSLGRLLAYRAAVATILAGVVAAWWMAARWLFDLSLTLVDDRAPLLVEGLLLLPVAVVALSLLLLQAVGVVLVARGATILDGLLGASLILRRQWVTVLALWLLAWTVWLAVTWAAGLAPAHHPLLGQAVVLVRAATHLWLLCALWRVCLGGVSRG